MVIKKRGLSDVVTTLIIILLVIVAVGIIWVVLRNMINRGTEQLSTTDFTTDLQIQKVTVNPDSVDVKVSLNQGQQSINGVLVSISDGTNSQTFEEMVPFNIQEEKTLNVPYNGTVSEVKISPIIIDDKGQKRVGQVTDTYKYNSINSGTCTPDCTGKVCGSDGCSGSCGTCSGTTPICNGAGQCVATCTDTCTSLGYNCGTQTVCGASTNCGTCSGSQTCNATGKCVATCTDTCSSLGKACGTWTVCGASTNCGTCSGSQTCNSAGQCVSSTSNPPVTTGLVAWYRFEGNYLDSSGLLNNVSSVGSTPPTFVTGKYGQAISVSTSTDYIYAANSASLLSSGKTIIAWINPSSVSGNENIFARYNHYRVRLVSGGKPQLIASGGSTCAASTTTFTTGSWQFIAVSNNGSQAKFYKDSGTPETVSCTYTDTSTSSVSFIGMYQSSSEQFVGSIDELMVYNRALTDAEISSLYSWAH